MAVRRARGVEPISRLRASHVARVLRTADKVRKGRIGIEDVVPDLRRFVEEELSGGKLARERAAERGRG